MSETVKTTKEIIVQKVSMQSLADKDKDKKDLKRLIKNRFSSSGLDIASMTKNNDMPYISSLLTNPNSEYDLLKDIRRDTESISGLMELVEITAKLKQLDSIRDKEFYIFALLRVNRISEELLRNSEILLTDQG